MRRSASLSQQDKKVIQLFTARKPGQSKTMTSTGDRLDGYGAELRGVAFWEDDQIWLVEVGSRTAQSIHTYLKKLDKTSHYNLLIGGYKSQPRMRSASASDIIRNLENRVARLEKSASYTGNKGNYAFGMLPESERAKADLHYSLADWFESKGIDAWAGAPADDSWWCEVDATPEEIMEVVKSLRGRGQYFTYKGMKYGISMKMHKATSYMRNVKGKTSRIHLVDGSSMALPTKYLDL